MILPPKTTFFVSKRTCIDYIKPAIIGSMLFVHLSFLVVFVKVPMILVFSSAMAVYFLSTLMTVFFLPKLMTSWIPSFLP